MEYNPIQTNALPFGKKIKNIIWGIVNCTLYRFSPSKFSLFRYWRVALIRLFGGEIDWHASLHPSSKIEYPWNLKMARNASLGEKSWVYAMDKISIGENSCIGKDVYLLTGSHNIYSSSFDLVTKPISIGKGVWVATKAMVLPGIEVGDFSVVAAGSVVLKDVEPWTIVGGNPAKFIKKREIK